MKEKIEREVLEDFTKFLDDWFEEHKREWQTQLYQKMKVFRDTLRQKIDLAIQKTIEWKDKELKEALDKVVESLQARIYVLVDERDEIRKQECQKTAEEKRNDIERRINKLKIKHKEWEKKRLVLHSLLSLNWGNYSQKDDFVCPICIVAKELKELKKEWLKK